MAYVVRMPQLGMTMEEGEVVEWPVEVGEAFEEGDLIAVVESEKTTNDVEARESGQIVEQFVDVNEPVGPGDPIAYVGEEGESVPDDVREEVDEMKGGAEAESEGEAEAEAAETESEAAAETGGMAAPEGEAKVSPRARSYAREQGIDESALTGLEGSGPGGAVVEADVVAAESQLQAGGAEAGAGAGLPSGDVEASGRNIYEERSGAGMRQSIADRMTQSIEAPQVTLNRRADVEAMLELKDNLEEDRGLKLSISDFVLAAVVDALEEYPEFNAIYEDDTHKLAGNINVGTAVDIENGLITPVIKGAGQRSITELREERQRLVSLAQSGEFTMDDLADGTFTVTNLGHFDVESFDPLLNPPQVAILGVNNIQTEYDHEAEEARRQIGLSLTFDHRAADGADAARFLAEIVDGLEHPLRLLTFGRGSATQESAETGGSFHETEDVLEGERTARTHSEGGMQADVQSRRFQWRVDEPEDQGGTDTAPNPVEQFVGSLTSCLTLMIGHMADRREVAVDDVTVTAEATPPEGRIEQIDVDVVVQSDDDPEDVERVVEMAERACYVNQVIDDDVEREISITVE